MLHGQSDVIGGKNEKAMDVRVGAQLLLMCLHKAAQSPVTHKLHDQHEGLCKNNRKVKEHLMILYYLKQGPI